MAAAAHKVDIAWDRRPVQAFDAAEQLVDIDFGLEEAGAAADWGRSAKLGDPVTAMGPRGRARPPRGDWRFLRAVRPF